MVSNGIDQQDEDRDEKKTGMHQHSLIAVRRHRNGCRLSWKRQLQKRRAKAVLIIPMKNGMTAYNLIAFSMFAKQKAKHHQKPKASFR